MSWTGGHRSGLPPFPPGGPWGPPAPTGQNYRQNQMSGSRHEQDRLAAARKRKEESRAAAEEQKRKDGMMVDRGLFAPPTKSDTSQASEVEKVMGTFNPGNSHFLTTAYLGVDYAPPTPAPVREHIIGEEDEEDSAAHKSSMRKPPVPTSRPHPAAPARPPSSSLSKPHHSSHKPPSNSWSGGSMAPPMAPSVPAKPSHKQPSSASSSSSSKKQPHPKLSPLKMPSSDKKSSSSSSKLAEDDDADVAAIFREMKNPYSQIDGGLPTPLSGIETPRVDVEERGSLRTSKPVYLGNWGRPLSPPKKSEPNVSKTPTESSKPPVVKKDYSSSDQEESSSASDSEESDDKDDFGLGSLMKPIRSPGLSSSERSVKPDPSPRYPTQSPYTGHITPSPAPVSGHMSQSPSPSSPPTKSDKSGAVSPLHSMVLPELMPPLSPMGEGPPSPPVPLKNLTSDSEHESVTNKSKVKPTSKPSNSSVQLSSDEEYEMKTYKEKQKKRKKSSSTKSGSGSERGRNRKTAVLDDSDYENDPFTLNKDTKTKVSHGRSHSTSPIKKPSSRKTPSSAQSTPRHKDRSSSSHTTPVRDKKPPTPKSKSKHVTPSQKRQSASTIQSNLSGSDEDELPNKSPAVSTNKDKNKILTKMFGMGAKGGGGGKGKDKGRGKGGITVIDRQESDDIDDERITVSKSSPIVNKSSEKSNTSKSQGEKEKNSKSWTDSIDSSSWGNITKKGVIHDDLAISDDDSVSSPVITRQPTFTPVIPAFKTDPDTGRPSCLISLPLSKLGRSSDMLLNRYVHQRSKKPVVKQECWITSGDERGGSGSGRKRKQGESPVKPEIDRPSDRTLSQHRKSSDRTHLSASEVTRGESRKRRDRDQSPEYDSDHFTSKRVRTTPSPRQDSISSEINHDSYYGPDPEPPPPDPSLLPPAHPTWPGPGNLLMPPPYPPKRVYYSYFERKNQDEAFDDEEENVVDEAKRLKHEADQEQNMNTKCRKYLQATMMFTVCGSRTETMGDKINAYQMYIQTLSIIKFLMKLTNSSRNNNQDVDTRLVVLSLRTQSLLNLKLYKIKRHELKDYQKTIQDVLARSEDDQSSSDQGQNRTEQMSTPSPAGSEGSNCSKSSDYYSSGENRVPGVHTPPTSLPVCLSIPRNVIQNQYSFCSYLSQCHELWEQADLYVVRGMCEEFFIRLDQECGPLTLHSSLKDLVNYTRKGLETIEHDRQSSSGMISGIPPTSDSFRL